MAGERILVADDEPDVLDVAVRALNHAGYQVTGVSSGSAAVEEAQRHPYELLVTDVKMPGITGLRAFRLIKAFSPEILGLVITGYGTLEMAIEAVRLGATAFILKPFGPDELCAAVGRALEGKRLAQENMRLRALLPVHKLTSALVATRDLQALATQVVEAAAHETRAAAAAILLLDENRRELYQVASFGAPAAQAGVRIKLGESIAGWVVKTSEPMRLQGGLSGAPEFAGLGLGGDASAICQPLVLQGKAIGALCVAKAAGQEAISEADGELLSILAGGAAVAIENARLFTHLQDAYERLAELDHRKSEFISLAAHELRSPLAAVITYATLLEDEIAEPTRQHLQVILEAATRLRLLLDDMLNLRNLDVGSIKLQQRPVPIRAAVEKALGALAHMARDKQHAVSVELPDDLPEAFADPDKLQIILLNLIANAIKFTPNGGRITIDAAADGGEILFSVRDTGIGVPEAERERIFERFYQVADSLRREAGGLGLGLSIVKGMVDLHGGRIWVESQVAQGSTFYFTLPRWSAPQ